MPKKSSVRVLGVADVNKAFEKKGVLGNSAMSVGVEKVAKIVQEQAAKKAPKDSGLLSRSIIVKLAGKGAERSAQIGPDRAVYYAAFVEFGTSSGGTISPEGKALEVAKGEFVPMATHKGASGQAYLRPAFDENVAKAIESVSDQLKKDMGL